MPVTLTPRERAHLKARAHALEPRVQVGHSGLTSALANEVDRALIAHELIKVKILDGDRDVRAGIAAKLCEQTDAALVQSVGKVFILWRPKPDEATALTNKRKRLAKLCAWCRRFEAPDGTWQTGRRAEDATAQTHGICPDCSKRDDL